MDRAVMRAAQWHGKLIAGPAAERARLQIAKMMRVGWSAAADKARLFGDIAKVLAVAITPWRSNGENALVDADGLLLARLLLIAGPQDSTVPLNGDSAIDGEL